MIYVYHTHTHTRQIYIYNHINGRIRKSESIRLDSSNS